LSRRTRSEPEREDSDVVGNVLLKTESTFVVRFGGDGTGETFGRYRFVNNTVLVQDGGSAVFRLFDGIESLSAHNNVFAVVGGGALNMVRMVEANWSSGNAVISGSNNWVADGASNVPASWNGTITGTDPGFADAAAFDFRPIASSVLVDAGSATTADPSGYDFPNALTRMVTAAGQRRASGSGSRGPCWTDRHGAEQGT
jgi:hypothetical protein